MAAFSDFLENAIINATLRNVSYTSPASVFVALFTTDPTDANSGTEVSGGSYARTAVTFGAPSGGVASNSGAVNFPTATGSWGTVTHFGVFDASTSGNLLYHGALAVSKAVGSGDSVSFSVGQLTVTLQ